MWQLVPPFIGPDARQVNSADNLSGTVRVTIRLGAKSYTRTIDLSRTDDSIWRSWEGLEEEFERPEYVSPAAAFAGLLIYFQEYPFTNEQLGQGRPYSRTEVSALRRILGKDVQAAQVFSVDLEMGDVPHFTMRIDGRTFDSTMMSLGELWVNYVVGWKAAAGRRALLVDEPESFLAQRAVRPFLDEIARKALSTDSQIIVATHSSSVLERFPLGNILMCLPGSGGIQVVTPTSAAEVRDAVGVETPIRGVILVEDEFAAALLSAVLSDLSLGLLREVDIVACGGMSEVKAGLRVLGRSKRMPVIGVLDGDQRAIGGDSGLGLLYLPGTESPEQELLKVARSQTDLVARRVSRSEHQILIAIQSIADQDHQYWLDSIAQRLGLDSSVLRRALYDQWLCDMLIRSQAESLTTSILRAVRSSGRQGDENGAR